MKGQPLTPEQAAEINFMIERGGPLTVRVGTVPLTVHAVIDDGQTLVVQGGTRFSLLAEQTGYAPLHVQLIALMPKGGPVPLEFRPAMAIIVERRGADGRTQYFVGVTSGVRTVEVFLRRPGRSGGWLSRQTARAKRNDLQHDLDRGLIKPDRALTGTGARECRAADLTGWVPLPQRSEV